MTVAISMAAASRSILMFSASLSLAPAFAIRWPRTMYNMNNPQFANAKTSPNAWPVMRITVMVATPAVVSASAPALRAVQRSELQMGACSWWWPRSLG